MLRLLTAPIGVVVLLLAACSDDDAASPTTADVSTGGPNDPYLAAKEAGMGIPDDISVVGYDDQEDLAADLRPALTTVRLPYYAMGHRAVEAIFTSAVSDLPPRTYELCPLVERGSLGPPPTRGRT